MKYILTFESFNKALAKNFPLHESINYGDLLRGEKVAVFDKEQGMIVFLEAADFVNLVQEAAAKFNGYEYAKSVYNETHIVLLLTLGEEHDTMAVDGKGNMYISINFLYNNCKMDPNRVFPILYHEVLHIQLDHMNRWDKFAKMTNEEYSDIANIIEDYEVNGVLVVKKVVTESFWKTMEAQYKKSLLYDRWENYYFKEKPALEAKFAAMLAKQKEANKQIANQIAQSIVDAMRGKHGQSQSQSQRTSADAKENVDNAHQSAQQGDHDSAQQSADAAKQAIDKLADNAKNNGADSKSVDSQTDKIKEDIDNIADGKGGKNDVDKTKQQIDDLAKQGDQRSADWQQGYNETYNRIAKVIKEEGKQAALDLISKLKENIHEDKQAEYEKGKQAALDEISDKLQGQQQQQGQQQGQQQQGQQKSGGQQQGQVGQGGQQNQGNQQGSQGSQQGGQQQGRQGGQQGQQGQQQGQQGSQQGQQQGGQQGGQSGQSGPGKGQSTSNQQALGNSIGSSNKSIYDKLQDAINRGDDQAVDKLQKELADNIENNMNNSSNTPGQRLTDSQAKQIKESLTPEQRGELNQTEIDKNIIDRANDGEISKHKDLSTIFTAPTRDTRILVEKNMERILEYFIRRNTTYAGDLPMKTQDVKVPRWGNKNYLHSDDIRPVKKERNKGEPQSINFIIDASGSVQDSIPTIKAALANIVVFADKYKYTGFNVYFFDDYASIEPLEFRTDGSSLSRSDIDKFINEVGTYVNEPSNIKSNLKTKVFSRAGMSDLGEASGLIKHLVSTDLKYENNPVFVVLGDCEWQNIDSLKTTGVNMSHVLIIGCTFESKKYQAEEVQDIYGTGNFIWQKVKD